MGSKACCCNKYLTSTSEITIGKSKVEKSLLRVIIEPQKPMPLEQPIPCQQEDDFGLFLVMEQYERLINKYRRKSRSYSPPGDLLMFAKENMTQFCLKKHLRSKNQKKTRSLTTKVSTSLQSTLNMKSILKNKTSHPSFDPKEGYHKQKSHRSVHFNVILSPKNSIKQKSEHYLSKKKLLCKTYL